jgi:HK97 family phage portal protein
VSLLERLLGGEERTSTLANPSPTLREAFGGGQTLSGASVNIENAIQLVPLFSGVSLIAGAIGSLPLVVYRRTAEGRERAENHRTYGLLHTQPNPEMGADEVWEIVGEHLNLWGNAFIWKARDSFGNVGELWPLKPSRIQVGRDKDGKRIFIVDGKVEQPYTETDILHIRGLSPDGLVGYSPVQLARNTLGNAISQGEFQSKFLGQDGKPSVLLRHPNSLKPDAAARLKAGWDSIKTGGTAVLEEGIEVERWTMPLEDAQFLEQMQFSDLRIAQLLNLPPSFLGAPTGDSLTYSTTEQQGLQFITYTLRRWLIRIEGSLLRDPSIFLQGSRFFPEFLVDGLLRADSRTRGDFYAKALASEAGWMSRNEVRDRENLPNEGESSE